MGQAVTVLVRLVTAIVRRVRDSGTFAVPLVGLLAVAALLFGGLALVASGYWGADILR
ncbi:MAG: hypothetical protein JWQ92_2523 [Amnibacterium sp.]|nr:hypothetical protein [Amnibacterium sp.]